MSVIGFIYKTRLEVVASKNQYWKQIEDIAEKYPFVAGLMNAEKEIICNGAAIHKQIVLTSANCAQLSPRYVVVQTAIVNTLNLIEVGSTRHPKDFIFSSAGNDPNATTIHNNIGVVLVVTPIAENMIVMPMTDNTFAGELDDKELIVVGYGTMRNHSSMVMQQHIFVEAPCYNPKWYYCVCGFEKPTTAPEYAGGSFLEGAPVVVNSMIVGVSSAPCCHLRYKGGEPYNVFTVIGPYLRWIDELTAVRAKIKQRNGTVTIRLDAFVIMSTHRWQPLQRVGIIGVPFEKGQKKYGVSVAPAAMRAAGLVEALKEIEDLDVKDYGDIETPAGLKEESPVSNMANLPAVSACNCVLSERVSQVLRDNRVAVTIGGDHCIGLDFFKSSSCSQSQHGLSGEKRLLFKQSTACEQTVCMGSSVVLMTAQTASELR
ncbi:Arginase-1 [Eumeta japonica]|uniref:Arginase-1 n=1 Tax=Eumeta variegata TaxID=151549 RepID=A0A4C1XSC5_EUMVA|nr:Arginase-1 [Eumeta japonica]